LAEDLLLIGNPNVITDVAAATEAARAAATTARINVEVNLAGIKDPESRTELTRILADVAPLARRAEAVTEAVRERLRR
jgi:methenyltetrahydrofolate cyclohydrolase